MGILDSNLVKEKFLSNASRLIHNSGILLRDLRKEVKLRIPIQVTTSCCDPKGYFPIAAPEVEVDVDDLLIQDNVGVTKYG